MQVGLTCDIWGLKLISFRSTDPGERLCNIWHRSTPSRRACAKSKTAAEGHTTRWLGGRTLQSINHRPHCLHSSISAPEDLLAKRVNPSPSKCFWFRRRAGRQTGGRAGGHYTVGSPHRSLIHYQLANRAISQPHVNRSRSPRYIPIPGACQLCSRHNMELTRGSKTTKRRRTTTITTTTPCQQIHSGRRRRRETEACYGNFLLFILKNFSSHIQSKKA